ncbi:sulfite exporter TauE/SafE family protein [Vreelandella gomseomensis]|uniref:Probable membrane transporter protein n=1 Tax=Vreelandella gomseomensis TaxID=370766 RepID=A0ABU1GDC3_9GAMM|nr:sulfite exporter TauE/SafE family protein [Halomonas gomseomensis]MDR5875481.1 sulfite exporter TauE/SafE family protein [Halomonas gomseomensis]
MEILDIMAFGQPLGEVSISQYVIPSLAAFIAAVIGGMSGYGTGLLLPPVLIPILGAEAVVPVVSLSALITNATRVVTFWNSFDFNKIKKVTIYASPACVVGAYGYTLLSGPIVSIIIGLTLILIAPARRYLLRKHGNLGTRSLNAASVGYGILAGGTSGSGVVLISILLSTGLSGVSVIATDAGISFLLGVLKVIVFQSAGSLPFHLWAMAAVIGISAIPGTLLAKCLINMLSGQMHITIINAVVLLGGGALIIEGVRGVI